jgi:CubicO group peptidase (beta-lactamase class C family)
VDKLIPRRQFVTGSLYAGILAALPGCTRQAGPGRTVDSSLASHETTRLARLEELILELMREAVVPGTAIALVKDGNVVWHRSFGVRDADSRAPVDERTVFSAASVSKTVFAYAVMQLCDRGVLELDTPLTKYLPDRILEGDPRLDLITARHVLSHTSGLPNFRSRAAPLRIHFTPGERYQYSGEGYWYLQSVITHLQGTLDPANCAAFEAGMQQCATNIDAYLKANVLLPCGMHSSTYAASSPLDQHATRRHDQMGRPLSSGQPSAPAVSRYAAMGGLQTTALDYAAFLSELLQARAAPSFRLTGTARQEMLRPHVQVDGPKWWALGWEIHETPHGRLIQHQGGQAGVQAFTAASLERAVSTSLRQP